MKTTIVASLILLLSLTALTFYALAGLQGPASQDEAIQHAERQYWRAVEDQGADSPMAQHWSEILTKQYNLPKETQ